MRLRRGKGGRGRCGWWRWWWFFFYPSDGPVMIGIDGHTAMPNVATRALERYGRHGMMFGRIGIVAVGVVEVEGTSAPGGH